MESKIIVVDANILRAAGKNTESSRCCRDILELIRKICHRVVVSDPITIEWNNHASIYARKWRSAMRKMSSEKFKEGLTVAKLSFQRIQNTKSVIDIMEKDAHLVAAALQYHKIIISLENKALMHFTINYTAINSSIGDVMWVNPSDVGSADIIRWLSGGCATVDEWKISNYSPKAK